ncbi:putative reverse transcriptase domain-containing protein [Tanacetum coccineum]|uniref:Reverse transcriptase domain-containing protein n=1 Tax=Tanacetum coccineum TaxID=301880 RepID=A0ABQ5D2M6_9ASTR
MLTKLGGVPRGNNMVIYSKISIYMSAGVLPDLPNGLPNVVSARIDNAAIRMRTQSTGQPAVRHHEEGDTGVSELVECGGHEMQKLEYELWNHAMVGVSHVVYNDRFHELARLVPHLVTPEIRMIERFLDEAVRNRTIKKVKKRGNMGEPNKDMNGRDDNKRTRTVNAFAATVNHVGRENTSTWLKCTTCNSYHALGGPCRTCYNCNHAGHLAKDCRSVPRNVNHVNARNPPVRACYECGSTDHVRPTCPRWNRVQRPGGNSPNQVVANNEGMDWLSNFKAEIICHEKVVRIPLPDGKVLRVVGERPDETTRFLMSAKASDKK